ncbi:hypothetical protein NDN08_000950 [Rhodosorus marinus]|uniref:Glycosyltransferase 2-like domain-containing protein n=1 Tax=Rhodosorus marinus TaxID=101924 RepID=A0AAV8UTL9_9RHOD|nr:hypothetical protein NDN08_000950 [Rhodosorus marinus]
MPPWAEISILFVVLLVIPVCVLTMSAPAVLIDLLNRTSIGTLALITSLSIVDFICALDMSRWKSPPGSKPDEKSSLLMGKVLDEDVEVGGKPEDIRLSVVIPCYLPNEVDIIENTIDQLMYRMDYDADYQVVVVYNYTPSEELKTEVQQLEYRLKSREKVVKVGSSERELVVKRCNTSSSKAENVNYGVGLSSGNVVGILDADHLPMSNSLSEVARLWTPETCALQGSSFVRNQDRNMLTRIVSIEEGLVYNVHHCGGSFWRGFGVFGGSNGFWRKSYLSQLLFDKDMLTEDIDVSLRALLLGGIIRHEPSVLSSELVPETVHDLWRQRLRWAQGWFQCSYKHFGGLMRSRKTSLQQKLGVTVMFLMREVWYYLMPTSIVITAATALRRYLEVDGKSTLHVHEGTVSNVIFLMFIITFSVELLYSYATIPRQQRLSYPWILLGIVCFIPFVFFLVLAGITGQFREMYGCQKWDITTRPGETSSHDLKYLDKTRASKNQFCTVAVDDPEQ